MTYTSIFEFQFHKGTIKTVWTKARHAALSHFNSIKVQLRHKRRRLVASAWISFQFHKGTIKTPAGPSVPTFLANFNSIKVQLRRKRDRKPIGWGFVFQFHKGTIKTQPRDVGKGAATLFQFHKGTIKTIYLKKILNHLKYFNSIKVQLRQRCRHRSDWIKLISIP